MRGSADIKGKWIRTEKTIRSMQCLNGFFLKVIAMVSMLLDHIGAVLFPHLTLLRCVGRVAFPIFVFLLVEGFFHTRNIRRYELRLFVFALLSEIPFDLAFNGSVLEFHSQNVFFTLVIGLVMLDVISSYAQGNYLLEIVLVIAFMAIAYLVKADYGAGGILLIYCFYRCREFQVWKYVCLGAVSVFPYEPGNCFSLLAVVPLLLYNGQRGFRKDGSVYGGSANGAPAVFVKYLFYIFYPAHLLILHAVWLFLR